MKRILWLVLTLCCTFQAWACIMHDPKGTMIEWFNEESKEGNNTHLSANLSTVTSDHKPTSRMVNFSWDENGQLRFYTHKNTQKVSHLATNPNVSMNIWLPTVRKQVTVEGQVTSIDQKSLEDTWAKMPRWMQLRFISSDHKSPFMRPDLLKVALKETEAKYPNEVPMPDSFMGYRVAPEKIVFFQVKMPAHATKHIAKQEDERWVVSLYQP